jgi:ABC-type multidrug transport system ATPase subunit
MNTLSIDHVSLSYKKDAKVLDDISLEITNGMFGLLGPNGAGKSSLMRTIAGLQKPDAGRIFFNNTDVVKHPQWLHKQLGFLPQDFGVYPKVTAYQLLDHLAILKGVGPGATRKKQIMMLLERVNLAAFRNSEVHTFSGGMRQRFGVAQALLGNPQLIIADEPTAGLDPEERNRFNLLLSDISENIVVILSTHLVEDVRNLCSQMAVIRNGCVQALGRPAVMIDALKGKIWTRAIAAKELPAYQAAYRVISQQLVEKVLLITIFSDEMPAGFAPAEPVLEHVYFHSLSF